MISRRVLFPLFLLFLAALACSRQPVPLPTAVPTPPTSTTEPPIAVTPRPNSTPGDGGTGGAVGSEDMPTPSAPTASVSIAAATQPPIYVGETTLYFAQAGDTLPVIAERFDASLEEIAGLNGLALTEELIPGQVLVVPARLSGETLPALQLVPDSELVYSLGVINFDAAEFARSQPGYLGAHREFAEGQTRRGDAILQLIADHYSVSPRLLLALLEHQSGWLTNPSPDAAARTTPLGYRQPQYGGLYQQLAWAADTLNFGYYHWRDGSLIALDFPDGSLRRLAPGQNAGTVALQYLFSRLYSGAEWQTAVSAEGFLATYRRLFGDPQAFSVDPLIPPGLDQPEMQLPFHPERTWIYSGGPHGAWQSGSAWAALDFAPPSVEAGCALSDEWVTAAATGLVVRAGDGTLVLDLDGDGHEQSGWVLFYMHVAERDRAPVGSWMDQGRRLGHPSCEGGFANGTHVHIARKFNGEWVPADGPAPFVLSGWTAHSFGREYRGSLTRGAEELIACDCVSERNKISLER